MIGEILTFASIWWLVVSILAILASAAFPLFLYRRNRAQVEQEAERWHALAASLDTLKGCSIDNLPRVEAKVNQELPELGGAVKLLAQDSQDVFRGNWIPEPESRLPYPASCAPAAQAAVSNNGPVFSGLIGLGLFVLALLLAFIAAGSFSLAPLVGALALMPLAIGLVSLFILYEQRGRLQQSLAGAHRKLVHTLTRKVPVYTQAGETAIVLNRYTDHDEAMLASVRQLTQRVERLAAGEITTAITDSVKHLLAATIGPPLQRSSEALARLAIQLEKQMSSSLNTLGDRLIALEYQQAEGAKFLQNQYETVTSTLLQQQEMSFKQLGAVQSLLLEQIRDQQQQTLAMMTENQKETLTALSEGQQYSYRTLSNEQQESVKGLLSDFEQAMKGLIAANTASGSALTEKYQQAWSEWQGGLALTVSSLVAAQEKLNNELQTAQAGLLAAVNNQQAELAAGLSANQTLLQTQLTDRQAELAASTFSLTEKLATTLEQKLELLTESLAGQQTQVTQELTSIQNKILTTLASQSAATGETLLGQQARFDDSWQKWSTALAEQQSSLTSLLTTSQQELAASTSDLTKTVSTELLGQQSALSADLRNRQDEFARSLQTQQVELANTMQSRQAELLQAFQLRQEDLVRSLQTSQETLASASNELQERLQAAFQTQQLTAITQLQQAQDATLNKIAVYQQSSLDSMTADVAKNLGSYLDKYLEPVSNRLIASADVLVAAQAYADKVQDAFELQREQVVEVEAGMKDAINAFVETRTTMLTDLTELRASAATMSTSADKMSAIFSGSESGLSDSIGELAATMTTLQTSLVEITSSSLQNARDLQEQMETSHQLNQQQISDLAGQITTFSDELSTRIEQLTLGFTGITEDLVNSVHASLNEQNSIFANDVRNLVEILGEESRSMSLFAQQINSDIQALSSTLGDSVTSFNTEIRTELNQMVSEFDHNIADVLKRLSHATTELGDAVDGLPQALAPVRRPQ
jgi:hypothetical protein